MNELVVVYIHVNKLLIHFKLKLNDNICESRTKQAVTKFYYNLHTRLKYSYPLKYSYGKIYLRKLFKTNFKRQVETVFSTQMFIYA